MDKYGLATEVKRVLSPCELQPSKLHSSSHPLRSHVELQTKCQFGSSQMLCQWLFEASEGVPSGERIMYVGSLKSEFFLYNELQRVLTLTGPVYRSLARPFPRGISP